MSLLRFNFARNSCPPDEYVYHHQDGHVTQAKDQDTWFAAIRKHMVDNGYPVPPNLEELAVDQRCRTLPPGFCKYEDGTNPSAYIDRRRGPDDLMRGMQVLFDVLNPFTDPLVDQELAESRAATCAACPANVDIQGCFSCNNMADAITRIRGSNKTKADHVLKSCAVCSCLGRAQVWVKPEILAKGVTDDMMTQFRSISHCWKWKEIDALAT
jgi:hypothetical protein